MLHYTDKLCRYGYISSVSGLVLYNTSPAVRACLS